jgi:hypothetical protein
MTDLNPNTVEGFKELMRISEHRARCYIQGSRFHEKLKSVQPIVGEWSVHFRSHPRVREAEAEGWARDLRAACVAECKRRLMKGEDPGEPDDLMPKRKEWWDGVRSQAARERAATAARDNNDRLAGTANAVLTDLSKRMTGEAGGE